MIRYHACYGAQDCTKPAASAKLYEFATHRGRVAEEHRDAVACQLVKHDDLIGIHTGQAIWGETPDRVKLPGFGGISQRIETGAI